MSRFEVKILCYIVLVPAFIGINYFILDPLLIPDSCYYHSHKAGFFIGIFYTISSTTGGHPEPNLFNFLFTLAMGIILSHYTAHGIYRNVIPKD